MQGQVVIIAELKGFKGILLQKEIELIMINSRAPVREKMKA